MSAAAESPVPAKTGVEPSSDSPQQDSPRTARRPPRLRRYLFLNLAVWAFLAVQTWLLSLALGSARGMILVGLLLALGFAFVSAFDYLWLRYGRR